ncbi:hypothetical protein BHE74_00027071 [Ensete ventricosum]|uniref:Uncharacterized protein n=1 Tax=Ensete ventricosum TaxID=4639 RepID=A0A445MJA2_ENSVE|nr:hypothetical protein BHE74_00027071 [Ensete ventricosum]RZR74283.1 hypothetical protein BHM03_00034770 [Ensete ventricosum]
MLRPGVTQKWVDEGELPRERTKNRRWRRPYDVFAEATHGEVVVRRWVFRLCATKLASDESLGHQHMGVVYHQGRSQIASTSESHGGDLIIQRWSKGARKRRRVQWSSATQKQSVGYKGGGLGGALQYRRGGSTDREGRDADARQHIVGSWAWQHYGT